MCTRCAELEEEVQYLREQLGQAVNPSMAAKFRVAFDLTPAEACIIAVLYRARGYVQSMDLRDALAEALDRAKPPPEGFRSGSVYLARIRKRLGKDFVESRWGMGYRLSDDARVQATEALARDLDTLIGLKPRKVVIPNQKVFWSDDAKAQLLEMAALGYRPELIGEKLGKTPGAVLTKGYKLGASFKGGRGA